MMYDGRRYQKNRWIGWRHSREGDKYTDGAITHHEGDPIPNVYVVVFRVKNAPKGMQEVDGFTQEVYYPQKVESDKLIRVCAHTATNVALGMPKKGIGKPLKDTRYNVGQRRGQMIMTGERYIEQAHYLVKNNSVYQWTSRRPADKED